MESPGGLEVEAALQKLLSALRAVDDLPYDGEPVDQLQHALQCAALAREAVSDREIIVAALLHDIGRSPIVLSESGAAHEGHGAVARRWLAPLVGERVAWLAEQHVPAKRYLIATDPAYWDSLTKVSVNTLHDQGGPMGSEEAAEFERQPGWEDAVQLRRWDDLGKEPNAEVPSLNAYEAVLRSVIRANQRGSGSHV